LRAGRSGRVTIVGGRVVNTRYDIRFAAFRSTIVALERELARWRKRHAGAGAADHVVGSFLFLHAYLDARVAFGFLEITARIVKTLEFVDAPQLHHGGRRGK